jgi:branched-chain amino acid aminotransferase
MTPVLATPETGIAGDFEMIPMDDRDGFIWFDGKLVPWRDAKIHVLTHGLHYASAVFEGVRAYGGVIFELTRHNERLATSAKLLGFSLPFTTAELDEACQAVLAANGHTDAYVRPIAWRGSEQLGVSAQQTKIHVAIATWEWPSYFAPELREKGIKLTLSKWRRPAPDTAPTAAKAAGLYMICTLSKHAAEAEGWHDALMLDYRGQIAEATGANFFLVKDGVVHTPTPDCFLNGLTRQTVIGLARARGLKVVERAMFPEELATADEIFVTGSAAEVTAIGQIDDYHYPVGPITRLLRDDYEKLVRRMATSAAA